MEGISLVWVIYIMLDHRCVPILIEVNHSPSFETSSPLDDVIKTTVIRDTLRLAGIDADTLMKNAKRDNLLKKIAKTN